MTQHIFVRLSLPMLCIAIVSIGCGNSPLTAVEPVTVSGDESTHLVGTFVPRAHSGKGTATVETLASGERRIRFASDFRVDNGPKLSVYLSKSTSNDSKGHIDGAQNLGRLQAIAGEQAYLLATDGDLAEYHSVIVWCDDFSVLFTIADLLPRLRAASRSSR